MESMVEGMEHAFVPLLQVVRLLVEATAAFWIIVGVGCAVAAIFAAHVRNQPETFRSIRLRFSRYLSLALEFQLAADLLSTAIAPTFDELGKLAITARHPYRVELLPVEGNEGRRTRDHRRARRPASRPGRPTSITRSRHRRSAPDDMARLARHRPRQLSLVHHRLPNRSPRDPTLRFRDRTRRDAIDVSRVVHVARDALTVGLCYVAALPFTAGLLTGIVLPAVVPAPDARSCSSRCCSRSRRHWWARDRRDVRGTLWPRPRRTTTRWERCPGSP